MTIVRVLDHATPCATLITTREHIAGLDERSQATKDRLDGITVTLRALLVVGIGALLSALSAVGLLVASLATR